MCALAHVFEAAGLATVALASIRSFAERMRPPRALYAEFPLGRPLGRVDDPAYQVDVLRRAFALLDEPSGPVLVDHPDVIELETVALACPLPPRLDPNLHPAIDELRGLRPAWERTRAARGGLTSVGRTVPAERLEELVVALQRIVDGTPWKEAGLPGAPAECAHDMRTFYEEAALSLDPDATAPGRAEAWFYDVTRAGRLLLDARVAMKEAQAPFHHWFYLARGTR